MKQLQLIKAVPASESLDHVSLIDGHVIDFGEKSLLQRATGRFYTHELIGRQLARAIVTHTRVLDADDLHVIDPFCGDGRLVEWLLEEASPSVARSWHIALWDCDDAAVEAAVTRVRRAAERRAVQVTLDASVGDTFARALTASGRYQVVVTNPPWELVKPDRRELTRMTAEVAEQYVAALRAFDSRLRADYPDAQPERRFAGWGTNLARVGTDVALQLVAAGGACGVVSPSSLFADSNSEALRRRLFEEMTITNVTHYPAEARLFDGVDVPCVTFVAVRRRSRRVSPTVTRFDSSRRVADSRRVTLSHERLHANGFVLPVAFGAAGVELLDQLATLPRFVDLEGNHREGLWAGRELDETRKERYLTDSGTYTFAKGVNVRRFGIAQSPALFIDPDRIALPRSVKHPRLAWRDVSRPNQRRRVQATLIPPGWVTGNSLGVAYFRDDNLLRLTALLALVSSIPFEYQLRSMLSTGHVSLATMRRVHLPCLDESLCERLGSLAVSAMDGVSEAEVDLEAEAAKAYGLDLGSWELMLRSFPKLTGREIDSLLARWSP